IHISNMNDERNLFIFDIGNHQHDRIINEHHDRHQTQELKPLPFHLDKLFHRQTLLYLQHYILRIPLLLLFDYLFTEQFTGTIISFLDTLFERIDNYFSDTNNLTSITNVTTLSKAILDVQTMPIFNDTLSSFSSDTTAFTVSATDILFGNFHNTCLTITTISLSMFLPVISILIALQLLLCTDRKLTNVYSYIFSGIIIYYYYQVAKFIQLTSSLSLNTYIIQFLLYSMYSQIQTIRPHVQTIKIQMLFGKIAPFLLILLKNVTFVNNRVWMINCFYYLWILFYLSEIFVSHRRSLYNFYIQKFLLDIYTIIRTLGLPTLFNYVQVRVRIITLFKIFYFTKLILMPLYFRSVYETPYVNGPSNVLSSSIKSLNLTNIYTLLNMTTTTNITNNVNINRTLLIENLMQKHPNLIQQLNNQYQQQKQAYNVTFTKTIYFTTLYYGTETTFTLISLTLIVSVLMKHISYHLFRLLDLWSEDAEQIGFITGVMFFLLLTQSNLSRLNLDQRHIPLCKAFSLLVIALLHFLHTQLEPQLLKVAVQNMATKIMLNNEHQQQQQQREYDETSTEVDSNTETQIHRRKSLPNTNIEPSIEKTSEIADDNIFVSSEPFYIILFRSYNHRHVYTSLSIILFLFVYITLLWRICTFSTWLLAITAFALELSIRLLAALAQYSVYVMDINNRLKNLDKFDDYIFYIKAVTSCFEFLLALLLLFNGLYILFFESRGTIRAFMLGIHAHFNIHISARKGYKIYKNRKTAWNNVNKLRLATSDEIKAYNDICKLQKIKKC
ncbi:unnamed protein product, partial [Didymodactylos carnosus]